MCLFVKMKQLQYGAFKVETKCVWAVSAASKDFRFTKTVHSYYLWMEESATHNMVEYPDICLKHYNAHDNFH